MPTVSALQSVSYTAASSWQRGKVNLLSVVARDQLDASP